MAFTPESLSILQLAKMPESNCERKILHRATNASIPHLKPFFYLFTTFVDGQRLLYVEC
jgi:hypothetical protein